MKYNDWGYGRRRLGGGGARPRPQLRQSNLSPDVVAGVSTCKEADSKFVSHYLEFSFDSGSLDTTADAQVAARPACKAILHGYDIRVFTVVCELNCHKSQPPSVGAGLLTVVVAYYWWKCGGKWTEIKSTQLTHHTQRASQAVPLVFH